MPGRMRHGAGLRSMPLVMLAPLTAAGLYMYPEVRHCPPHSGRADTLAGAAAGSSAPGECRQEPRLDTSGINLRNRFARARGFPTLLIGGCYDSLRVRCESGMGRLGVVDRQRLRSKVA
ncbi:hypothetical protein C8R47DRAFT_304864 [Mycena vitilis]|nr:hypothetical protein C8R47DRAFT_304864 [Mycena vitilis]